MPRALFAAVSLLIVIAVVWVAGDWNAGDPAPPVAAPAEERPPAPPSRGYAGELEKAPTREPVAAETGAAVPPKDRRWIDVLVVDAESQEPVIDADVRWIGWEELTQSLATSSLGEEEKLRLFNDLDAGARLFGRRTTTDERGVARVLLGPWIHVVGTHGGRFGSARFQRPLPEPPGGYRLELAPEVEVSVRVVDVDGAPVLGIPLALSLHAGDGSQVRRVRRTGRHEFARSEAPDGVAHLRHLQQWTAPAAEGEPPIAEARVSPTLPGFGPSAYASFDVAEPPSEPVVLTLPAFGRVRARAEWRGEPLPQHPVWSQVLLYQGSRDDSEAFNNGWWRPTDADGWALFPWVPAGAGYAVHARLGFTQLHQKIEGPRRHGDEVAVRLSVDEHQCVLTGRLLDEDWELVREQNLHGSIKMSNGSGGFSVHTDASGRFYVFLGRHEEGKQLERLDLEWRRQGELPRRASVPPGPLQRGLNDVGDLVLSAGDIVVAGALVTERGPFRGQANLVVERRVTEADGRSEWRQATGLISHRHPENGHFEIRGEVEPGRLRLKLPGWGHHVPIEPIEFAPGMRDLVVRLDPGSTLTATLRAPPDAASGLRGALVRRDGGDLVERAWRADKDRLQVTWRAVPAGTYDLELRVWADPEPVAVIEDVAVPPPEGGDPRLDDIDLRGSLAVLRLRFVDPTGAAISTGGRRGLLFAMGLPPEDDWPAFEVHGDTTVVVLRETPVDLLAALPGYRPKPLRELVETRAAHEVRLDPWPEVELAFGGLPLPPDVTLHARLESYAPREPGRFHSPSSRGPRWPETQPRRGDTRVRGGRVRQAVGDGPHRVVVWLRREESRRTARLDDVTPRDVASPTAGSVIQVQVPDASVRAALAKLDELKSPK